MFYLQSLCGTINGPVLKAFICANEPVEKPIFANVAFPEGPVFSGCELCCFYLIVL